MSTPIPSPDDLLLIQSLRHKKEAIHEKVTLLKEEIDRLSSGLLHIEATIALLSGNKVKQKRHRISKTNISDIIFVQLLHNIGNS